MRRNLCMHFPIAVYLDRAQPRRASSPGTTTRRPAPERGRRGSWRWPSFEALYLVRRTCDEQGAHLPLELALVADEDVAASLHDDRQVLHRIAFSVVSEWYQHHPDIRLIPSFTGLPSSLSLALQFPYP